MADHAIARIADESTREAFLAVRTEFYQGLNKLESIVTLNAREQAALIASQRDDKDGRVQWQESARRILERMDQKLDDHLEHDDARFALAAPKNEFDAHVDAVGRWQWRLAWSVIGTAGAIIVLLLTIVGYLLVHHGLG